MSTQNINLRWPNWASSAALLLITALSSPALAQAPNAGMRMTVPAPAPPPPQAYPPHMVPAASQSVGNVWTLDQLVQLAEQHNPSMAKAQGQIQSARGTAVQAGLYPNPTFDSNTPEQIAGRATNLTAGFFQEVVVKGKKRLDRSAANEAAIQAELTFVKARFDALTNIRSQFYSVLAAERRLALQRELLEIAAATKRAAEGRLQAFQGTETDVLLLTIELQNTEIATGNFQTSVEGSRRKLAATVGIPELPIAALQGDLYGPLPTFDEGALQQFIIAENAQVQSAKVDVTRNRLLLRRAEVEPYPNIKAGPTYYAGLDPRRVPQQFGIQVVFTIPAWDRNQGNIQSQQGTLDAAAANVGLVQNTLLGEAANTLSLHRAAQERAETYGRDILPNTQRTLQMTRSGYNNGLLDISTLLQAQRSLLETNKDLIDALEDAWTTSADLAGLLQRERFP